MKGNQEAAGTGFGMIERTIGGPRRRESQATGERRSSPGARSSPQRACPVVSIVTHGERGGIA
jgi:hypothetical protein